MNFTIQYYFMTNTTANESFKEVITSNYECNKYFNGIRMA